MAQLYACAVLACGHTTSSATSIDHWKRQPTTQPTACKRSPRTEGPRRETDDTRSPAPHGDTRTEAGDNLPAQGFALIDCNLIGEDVLKASRIKHMLHVQRLSFRAELGSETQLVRWVTSIYKALSTDDYFDSFPAHSVGRRSQSLGFGNPHPDLIGVRCAESLERISPSRCRVIRANRDKATRYKEYVLDQLLSRDRRAECYG